MPNTRKILIIDDDPELRGALTEQLSLYEEYEAVAAENGSKGVQAAKAEQIDLVIMDVGLPDIDGREAVRILRRNGFKAPIIMLTGHDTDSDTILGLESGANDYVTKPFACAHPHLASPVRDERGRGLHDRPVQFSAKLEAAAQSHGQQGPLDREGELNPALPLPRRPAAGIAGDAVAGSLGLQLGSHHAHARDAHLSITAKDREGCRRSGHPGHCRGRLQTDALIAAAMTINGTIEGMRTGGFVFGAAQLARGRPALRLSPSGGPRFSSMRSHLATVTASSAEVAGSQR